MKKIIALVLVLILVAGGFYATTKLNDNTETIMNKGRQGDHQHQQHKVFKIPQQFISPFRHFQLWHGDFIQQILHKTKNTQKSADDPAENHGILGSFLDLMPGDGQGDSQCQSRRGDRHRGKRRMPAQGRESCHPLGRLRGKSALYVQVLL